MTPRRFGGVLALPETCRSRSTSSGTGGANSAWTFTSVGGDLSPAPAPLPGVLLDRERDPGVALTLKDSRKLMAGLEYRVVAFRAGFAARSPSDRGADPPLSRPRLQHPRSGPATRRPLFAIGIRKRPSASSRLDVFVRYASAGTVTSALTDPALIYGAKRWVAGLGVGLIF